MCGKNLLIGLRILSRLGFALSSVLASLLLSFCALPLYAAEKPSPAPRTVTMSEQQYQELLSIAEGFKKESIMLSEQVATLKAQVQESNQQLTALKLLVPDFQDSLQKSVLKMVNKTQEQAQIINILTGVSIGLGVGDLVLGTILLLKK